jgi:hypothetical protein
MAQMLKKGWMITLAAVMLLNVFISPFQASVIPLTGSGDQVNGTTTNPNQKASSSLTIATFTQAVTDGSTSIRGIFVQDQLALRVIQQPADDAGYVSSISNVATQFRMAEKYGTLGFLAHNYLAGASFSGLKTGDQIAVVYGDGTSRKFNVTATLKFQALSPESKVSKFVDLNNEKTISAAELFKKVYQSEGRLVLQTCIQQGSELSWGRLFVIAEEV